MNLLTTAGRRLPFIAAVDQTGDMPEEQHPLGVPKRVIAEREAAAAAAEQKRRENAAAEAFRSGNWKGAGGEQRSLEEEAKRAVSGKKSTPDPGRKPRNLEELDATLWWLKGDKFQRLIELRGGCRCCCGHQCSACSDPITRAEAEQLGLLEPVGDVGAGRAPSEEDIRTAWLAACERAGGSAAWTAVEPVIGHVKRKLFQEIGHFNVMRDTPSKLRRAVIAALNALKA